jgi:hypothetical protein
VLFRAISLVFLQIAITLVLPNTGLYCVVRWQLRWQFLAASAFPDPARYSTLTVLTDRTSGHAKGGAGHYAPSPPRIVTAYVT